MRRNLTLDTLYALVGSLILLGLLGLVIPDATLIGALWLYGWLGWGLYIVWCNRGVFVRGLRGLFQRMVR